MSEKSDFSKFELQIAILCNLTLFTCWPSEAPQRETQEPSARLAKLIRSMHTHGMFPDRVQTLKNFDL